MDRSPELRDLILRFYEALSNGRSPRRSGSPQTKARNERRLHRMQ
jgi:hypothetical protein